MPAPFDRAAATVGNIVKLEHVNTRITDQGPATLFYLAGLGLTRDPYVNVSTNLMWVNVGRCQFHLPTGEPQVIRGATGLVVPSRADLLDRLKRVAKQLDGTKFAFREQEDHVETVCPWGNMIRCHAPDRERFGGIQLGMPYVEFDVPTGTAAGIQRFYAQIMRAPAELIETNSGVATRVAMGQQWMTFRETDKPLPEYDNYHIQIYVGDFGGPYAEMQKRGLISMETNAHEYRFIDMIDPQDGRLLYKLEHEVRSLLHPGYGRDFINRNPAQQGLNYVAGKDALHWALP